MGVLRSNKLITSYIPCRPHHVGYFGTVRIEGDLWNNITEDNDLEEYLEDNTKQLCTT